MNTKLENYTIVLCFLIVCIDTYIQDAYCEANLLKYIYCLYNFSIK